MLKRLLSGIGVVLAQAAYLLGVRKEITLENLTRAYPELSKVEIRRIAKESYSNLGGVFAEFLYLRFASKVEIARWMEVQNPELLTSSAGLGRGVILVSAHLCNWEWMAMALGLQMKHPLQVIVKNQTGRSAEKFLTRMRTRFGNSMLNAGDVRGIYRELKANQWLAILADQSPPPSSAKVHFFGRTVPAYEGPARLALRTRAPMIFMDCRRNPDGTSIMTAHEIPYSDLTDTSDDSVRILTQRHVTLLEECIRTYPARWLWQHRRWKNAEA